MERLAKLLEDYKEAVWQHAHSFTLDNRHNEEVAVWPSLNTMQTW